LAENTALDETDESAKKTVKALQETVIYFMMTLQFCALRLEYQLSS
jgi:hypothetical protein